MGCIQFPVEPSFACSGCDRLDRVTPHVELVAGTADERATCTGAVEAFAFEHGNDVIDVCESDIDDHEDDISAVSRLYRPALEDRRP